LRRLARAAEAWVWLQIAYGIIGLVAVLAVAAGAMYVLYFAANTLGL